VEGRSLDWTTSLTDTGEELCTLVNGSSASVRLTMCTCNTEMAKSSRPVRRDVYGCHGRLNANHSRGENGQRLHEGRRVVAFTSNGKRTRKKDATVWPDYNTTDTPSYSLRNSSQISHPGTWSSSGQRQPCSQSVRVMALCDHTPRHSKSSYRESFFAI
jgi:hypothetical protein